MDHVVDVDVVEFEKVKCLVERMHATFLLKRRVKAVTDNAVAESIQEERDIGEAVTIGDVGGVDHDEVS